MLATKTRPGTQFSPAQLLAPCGFDAGDGDLYRYVGNDATNATDPSGLLGYGPVSIGLGIGGGVAGFFVGGPLGALGGAAVGYGFGEYLSGPPSLNQMDQPGVTTEDGAAFAGAHGFGDEEREWMKKGCFGLCAIRTGSYRSGDFPQFGPDVQVYVSLDDALKRQKDLNQKIAADKEMDKKEAVLFAIGATTDITTWCAYMDKDKKEIRPKSLDPAKLGNYDFATAFQKADGTIVYWEGMPGGTTENPSLKVVRSRNGDAPPWDKTSWVYGVVVTDSKYRPPIRP